MPLRDLGLGCREIQVFLGSPVNQELPVCNGKAPHCPASETQLWGSPGPTPEVSAGEVGVQLERETNIGMEDLFPLFTPSKMALVLKS